MRSLTSRIERMEMLARRRRAPPEPAGDRELREAVSRLFDVVEQHCPHDPWSRKPGQSDLTEGTTREQKVIAAADRIAAGAPSEADLALLAALPADALRVFGHSAEEYVALLAEVFSLTPADVDELLAEGLRPVSRLPYSRAP